MRHNRSFKTAFAGLGFIAGLILALAPLLPQRAESATLVGVKPNAVMLPAALASEGWRLLQVPGKAKAQFSQPSRDKIAIEADRAVAFLYRPLGASLEAKRKLAWRWRIDEAAPATDLSQAPGDDRSLAVHLIFPVGEDELGFWERMDLALTRLVAPPMAGKVLTYVWGGSHPAGSLLANPYLEARGKIIILRGGEAPLGQWVAEEIDFVANYRRAFGSEPPAPAFVAISADSDDTGSRISGALAGLAFDR